MTVETVLAGQDVLGGYARKSPLEALAELIWNGLDAEADRVTVDYDTSSLDLGVDHHSITSITITDNGLGFTHERAREDFLSHGDSWKRSLNGQTPTGRRVLHGSLGRGRFFAYSLGHRVAWETVAEDPDGEGRIALTVSGERAAINEFDIGEASGTDRPTGTIVRIQVEQGKSLSTLLHEDAPVRLSAMFAPHLLGNADIEVRVDGRRLDPKPLLALDPLDIELADCDSDELGDRDHPVLRIIEWKRELKAKPPPLVFCNGGGASLCELPATDPDHVALRRPGLSATCYLMWDGFTVDGADLQTLRMKYPSIIDAAIRRYGEHLDERIEAMRVSIVERLKEEGNYPYKRAPVTRTGKAERHLYDLMLVTAQPALGGTRQQRALGAKLLHLAVAERPEALDRILEEVLNLSDEVREELADLLKRSSFPSIISAASEVSRRIDLLTGLRRLLYASEESPKMREVDQLHPIVRDNTWLFGEHWHLTRSETSLTNVLRSVIADTTILEADLDDARVVRADGSDGRVDLLLHRDLRVSTGFQRLVVELKRPSKALDFECLRQIKSYAQALDKSSAMKAGRWEFWLVGSSIHRELADDVEPADRQRGHVQKAANYDIWVMTWGELIDDRLHALEFVRTQLDYEVSQEDALERLGTRFGSQIPGWGSDDLGQEGDASSHAEQGPE